MSRREALGEQRKERGREGWRNGGSNGKMEGAR